MDGGGRSGRGTAVAMGVVAVVCVQLGAVISATVIGRIGVLGTAALRTVFASVLLLVIVRPRLRSMPRDALRPAMLLGVVGAGWFLAYLVAIDRLTLGAASALQFLGPLGVAVARRADRRAVVWPVLAAAGVVLLTRPWSGRADPIGISAGLLAAGGWASYILLTKRVGGSLSGWQALAVWVPMNAVVLLLVALPSVPRIAGVLDLRVLALSLTSAGLVSVLALGLELSALRRLPEAVFGTLMSFEPAVAALLGFLLLSQRPGAADVVGIAFVVLAAAGAARMPDQRAKTRAPST